MRKFEVRLPQEIWMQVDGRIHMKAATAKLKEALESGAITETQLADWIHESYALKGEKLSPSELALKIFDMIEDITMGKDTISEFTWHHHQELGRMELIPRWIHKEAKHTGGDSLWPRVSKIGEIQ